MLLRFLAKHFFIIDSGFFLPFHFGITNFVLSAEISHAKGCVCKINTSNFKIAEYFVVPINLHTTAFWCGVFKERLCDKQNGHISMYANSLFCSPAHSYTSVTKKEQLNEDNDKISPRQTFKLSSKR